MNRQTEKRFRESLQNWYQRNKRSLPWRETKDPYRIWISEIMLQQTRVAAVIPYYHAFLARFSTIEVLAAAAEADLLAAWSGLGYYSRARNLQKAAKLILERGSFPDDYDSIRELPGIGDYTAAALASIAFELPHAAVDGNVLRVLSRVTNEAGNIAASATRRTLQTHANRLLDRRQPGTFNQAMMELGAVVCMPRQPQCLICPLSECCQARKLGVERQLPVRAQRLQTIAIHRTILVIERAGKILLSQRPPDSKLMPNFWEIPSIEQLPAAELRGEIGEFRHTITHHRYRFTVLRALVKRVPAGLEWWRWERLNEIALSTAAKKALLCLHQRGLMSFGRKRQF